MGSAASTLGIGMNKSLIFSGDINFERVDDSTPSMPTRGVSIEFFDVFVIRCGGREALVGLNLVEVWEQFILPKTLLSISSYCDYLYEDCGEVYVGEATLMISNAWQHQFLDVVAAINNYFVNDKKEIVWFDLFSLNHHRQPLLPIEWLLGQYKDFMQRFQRIVMVLTPWQNPIPLCRMWCLWEVYCALADRNDSSLEIAMTAKGTKSFLKSILTSLYDIYMFLRDVDIDSADVSNVDHARSILAAVQANGGTAAVNASLCKILLNCLFTIALKFNAAVSSDAVEHGEWKALSGAEKKYRLPFESLTTDIYELLTKDGGYKQAAIILSRELSYRRIHYGDSHCRTLHVHSLIARCWMGTGDYSRSFACYKELLTLYSDRAGSQQVEVIHILLQLAVLYQLQGDTLNAIPIVKKVIHKQVAYASWSHIITIDAMSCLAACYEDLSKWNKAHRTRRRVLDILSSSYGDAHIYTAQAQGLLARSLTKPTSDDDSATTEAISLYKQCINKYVKFHSMQHSKTLSWMCEYGALLVRMGRLQRATQLYDKAWTSYVKLLGVNHPTTVEVHTVLNSLSANVDERRTHKTKARTPERTSKGKHSDNPEKPITGTCTDVAISSPRHGLTPHHVSTPMIDMHEANRGTPTDRAGVRLPVVTHLDEIPSVLTTLGVDTDQAVCMYKKVWRTKQSHLSNRHPSTLTSLHSLAVVMHADGRLDEAAGLFQEAVHMRIHVLSPTHKSTLDSKCALASVLTDLGKADRAETIYRECIHALSGSSGERHPYVMLCKRQLANLLIAHSSEEDLLEAVELLESVYRELCGSDDNKDIEMSVSMLSCLEALASLMEKLERASEYMAYLRKVVAGKRKVLGRNHRETLMAVQNLAVALHRYRIDEVAGSCTREYTSEAEDLLNEVIVERGRLLGGNHPSTLEAVHILSVMLE